jgi:hypothetical protein
LSSCLRHRLAITVVEALVALAILSSAIIPIVLFLSTGTETVRGTRDTAGAVFVANRTFEELRALPFDQLSLAASRVATASDIALGPIHYRRTLTMTPLGERSLMKAYLAWLKIEWFRDRKKVLAYEVGTVLSDVK